MPVSTKKEPPYFDAESFEHKCIVPGCDGVMVVWEVDLIGEDSVMIQVTTRCLNDSCGTHHTVSRPLTEHEQQVLTTRFTDLPYHPWQHGHDRAETYREKHIDRVKEVTRWR